MNWQKDKLTIIGFGIIFVILAVFGYLLWDMNREPMAEVSMTELAPVIQKPVDKKNYQIILLPKWIQLGGNTEILNWDM